MVSMQYMLAIELLFRVKLNIFCKIDCSIRVASILKFSCDFVYKIYFAKKRKQITVEDNEWKNFVGLLVIKSINIFPHNKLRYTVYQL